MDHPAPRLAVLKDYPLRLWVEQNEYFEGLMREYRLLLEGQASAPSPSAPRRLIETAEELGGRFGGVLQTVNAERQRAIDEGRDRMDSVLPMGDAMRGVLEHVREVLEESDEYCRQGRLLSLPRPPQLVAFAEWTGTQLLSQLDGAEPSPWPGPF